MASRKRKTDNGDWMESGKGKAPAVTSSADSNAMMAERVNQLSKAKPQKVKPLVFGIARFLSADSLRSSSIASQKRHSDRSSRPRKRVARPRRRKYECLETCK